MLSRSTKPFVDMQSIPRVSALTAHAVRRTQEFKYRLDGVLTRWGVFVEGLGIMQRVSHD